MIISGGGSTMEAIIKACQDGELQGLIIPALVIATAEDIGGIAKARALGIPVEVVPRSDRERFPKGKDGVTPYGLALLEVLHQYGVNVITLNGCLVKISPEVIDEFEGRLFNQHPGPVPEFGGAGMTGQVVHDAVLEYHRLAQTPEPYTKVITQRVGREWDEGTVVLHADVPIEPDDTAETLQARALPYEHKLQIDLLRTYATEGVTEQPPHLFAQTDEQRAFVEQAKAYAIKKHKTA
jgi:phosphoribosylglycinamide formyltransferase-1